MTKLKIKDKKVRYIVMAILGIAMAAATQLTNLEGVVGTISPSQGVIEVVVKEGIENASEGIIESILNSLF